MTEFVRRTIDDTIGTIAPFEISRDGRRRVSDGATRIALTIAGSDSGGGAGIQADLGVFTRLGVFGTTAVTAITAQNPTAVRRVHALPPSLVRAQIEAVVADLRPRAIKTGMLANGRVARAVALAIRGHRLRPYVLDPVMIASSGARLLDRPGVRVVRERLLPLATLVTPNLDEATVLTGEVVAVIADMERAARRLVEQGAQAALVTGGHLPGAVVVDVLYARATGIRVFRHPRIATRHTHGTGCTLSAAITAHLALGVPLPDAVQRGIVYVRRALRAGESRSTERRK